MQALLYVFVIIFLPLFCAPLYGDQAQPQSGSFTAAIFLPSAENVSTNSDDPDVWLAEIIDAHFRFRLGFIPGVNVLSTANAVGSNQNVSFRRVSEKKIVKTAAALQASHVCIHSYEINRKTSAVVYYLELFKTRDERHQMVFDKTFPLEKLQENLDTCIRMILGYLKIYPSPEIMTLLHKPILSSDLKLLRKYGDLAREMRVNESDKVKNVKRLLEVADEDGSFAVAVFHAATECDSLHDYYQSAQLFNALTLRCGLYYPAFYVKASRNFRLHNAYDLAQQVLLNARRQQLQAAQLLLEQIRIFERNREWESIKPLYQEIFAQDSANPEARLYFAREYNASGNFEEALQFLELSPSNLQTEYTLEKARSLVGLKRHAEAIDALKLVDDASLDSSSVIVLVADVRFDQNDFYDAARLYEKALAISPDSLGILLKTADAFRRARRFEKALAVLKKYGSAFYSSKAVAKEIGLLCCELKQFDEARAILEPCINLEPQDDRVLLALPHIYTALHERDKAADALKEAEKKVADRAGTEMMYAKLALLSDNSDLAEKRIRNALVISPGYPHANSLMGDIMEKRGKSSDALDYYTRERTQNGTDFYLQQKIAWIQFTLKNYNGAQVEAEKLVELDSSNYEALYLLTNLALVQKDTMRAVGFLTRAETLGEADGAVCYEIGKGFARNGMHHQAIRMFEKALATMPQSESVWLDCAESYEKTGKDSCAAFAYRKIYACKNQGNAQVLARAGHIFFALGLKEDAYTTYRMYLDAHHSDPLVDVHTAQIEFERGRYGDVIILMAGVGKQHRNEPSVIRMLALSYYHTRRYTDALPHLTRLARQKSPEPEIIEYTAISHEKTGNTDAAVALFSMYLNLERAPNRQEYAHRIATLYEKQRKYSNAQKQYQQNIKEFPGDHRNFSGLAGIHYLRGEHDKAEELLNRAIRHPSASPLLQKSLAEIYVQQKKFPEAVETYEKYLFEAPGDSSAWLALGLIYFDQGNYINTIHCLENALKFMHLNSSTMYKLAFSYIQSGNTKAAASALRKSIRRNGDNDATCCLSGDIFYQRKKYWIARNFYERALQCKPENEEIAYKLCDVYLIAGMTERAEGVNNNSDRTAYNSPWKKLAAARIREANGKTTAAIDAYHTALWMLPDNFDATLGLGRCYALRNNHTHARKYLLKAQALRPTDIEVKTHLAQTYLRLNQDDLALNLAHEIVAEQPRNSGAFHLMGRVYIKKNNPDEAIRYLEKALKYSGYSEKADIHFVLAEQYCGIQEYPDAIKQYNKAARRDTAKTVSAYQNTGDIYYLHLKDYEKAKKYYEKYLQAGGASKKIKRLVDTGL